MCVCNLAEPNQQLIDVFPKKKSSFGALVTRARQQNLVPLLAIPVSMCVCFSNIQGKKNTCYDWLVWNNPKKFLKQAIYLNKKIFFL